MYNKKKTTKNKLIYMMQLIGAVGFLNIFIILPEILRDAYLL